MKCEMCDRGNAEGVGIQCGKYKVCVLCIQQLIHGRMIVLGRDK
tara:strand:- start:167 stop:298 length:132 start_codon:yes stop_codon:yes gene_type:complete